MYRQVLVPFLRCFIKDDQTWYENKNVWKEYTIWVIDGLLLIGSRGNNFQWNLNTYTFVKKNSLEMWHAKWWPFLLGLGVLRALIHEDHWPMHLGCTWSFQFQTCVSTSKMKYREYNKMLSLKMYLCGSSQLCDAGMWKMISVCVWDCLRLTDPTQAWDDSFATSKIITMTS